jgi:hypothetical protein
MLILFYILTTSVLILGMALIEQFIIHRLNPKSKFVIWWKKHIIDEDPYHN